MAWSDDGITKKTVFGDLRCHIGVFSQGNGDTGGAIATGLKRVTFFNISAETKNIAVSGGTVTVTTSDPGAGSAGYWIALGY